MIHCLAPDAPKQSYTYNQNGGLKKHQFYMLNITLESFKACEYVWRAVDFVFPFHHKFEKKTDVDVAFQMISDDYFDTKKQVHT